LAPRTKKLKQPDQITFTDRLRISFKWALDPAAGFLNSLGIHPNVLTVGGLVGVGVGAYFISQGRFVLGGFLFMLMTLVDALDGPLARLRGESQNFGAFVDSVTDRYSELVVYAALLWYALEQNNSLWAMTVFFAAFGSVLVSYIRARAQSLGLDAKIGLFSRVERYIILGPSILFNIPYLGVLIIALGSNFTALQRIWYVRQSAYSQKKAK
jgi:CDP-diacylglycerol--glycerol-3-phosphate 3-phosphatidyltransferase